MQLCQLFGFDNDGCTSARLRPDDQGVVRESGWFWRQERAKKQQEEELRQQATDVLVQDEREQEQEVLWQAADRVQAEREHEADK